ncbi:L-lactate permease [uncultured Lactobacillus sp.]|uniref:L-lactate permease n=1 Tax=uncultured Lactobacillus sp. TaxID=153152 RepID=UPI002620EC27|nr:L-lactate permease [uncultured Lactobacillus sp.]
MSILAFVLALLPIVWLIVSLGFLKMRAPLACIIGLILTIILAIFGFKLSPLNTFTGTIDGIALGLWPIVYVIIAALFTYNVTNKSGGIRIIQDVLSSITTDKRILVLIIAWGFGGFLEAIAGFGTAVAIPAGILIAFGFEPIKAAIICLIANTTPTAFGAVGLPVITLANVTQLPQKPLSYTVTLQLLFLVIIIPYILVILTGNGFKSLKGVGFITFMAGLSFALPQIFIAKFIGAELPAILGSLICIGITVLLAKLKNKKNIETKSDIPQHSPKEFIRACSPFILVFVFVLLASSLFPPINHFLNAFTSKIQIYTGKNASPFSINWLSSPGTLILLATFIGGKIQGFNFKQLFEILFTTIKGLGKTAITVCSIVALAKVMGYAGMTQALATSFVKIMGPFYPVIAPLIGALGTFITGSDTSANVLFGNLQLSAAKSLGADVNWVVSSNMVGATAGKMISPQSIAVASAAINKEGSESTILKQALKWCGLYLVIICIYLYVSGLLLHKF